MKLFDRLVGRINQYRLRKRALELIKRMVTEQCLLFRMNFLGVECRLVGYGKTGSIINLYLIRPDDNVMLYRPFKSILFSKEELDEWERVLEKWVDSREQEIVIGRIRDMHSLSHFGRRYQIRFKKADKPHKASMFLFNPFMGEIVLPFGDIKSVWVFYIPGMFKSLGYVVTDVVSVSELIEG